MILFVITAVGGIVILALDLNRQRIPRALLFLHPLLAVVSLVLLLIFTFGGVRP